MFSPPREEFVQPNVNGESFLDYFRRYADICTDAPKSYIELSGLMCLSSIARNIKVEHTLGDVIPVSEYLMLVGVSTLSRKSTVLGLSEMVLSKYGFQGEMPVLPDLSIGQLSGSYEATLEEIAHRGGNALAIAREYHLQLKRYSSKGDYATNIPPMLMQLWDGSHVQHIVRDKSKSVSINNPHFTLIADVQPTTLCNSMDGTLCDSGFLARFIISFDQVWKEKPIKQISDENKSNMTHARRLLTGLKVAIGDTPRNIRFTEDAFQTKVKYSQEFDALARKHEDVSSFYSRCNDHLARLSALYALNNWDGSSEFVISTQDVDAAYVVVKRSIQSWEFFFPFVANNEKQRKNKITKFLLEKAGEKGMTPREILACNSSLKPYGMNRQDLIYFVDTSKPDDGLEILCNDEKISYAQFSYMLNGNYDMIKFKIHKTISD